ncbi:MAG: hypothetical protein Q9227_001427 [Pyrenula ochraceoflavens]
MASLLPLLRFSNTSRTPATSALRLESPVAQFLCPWIQTRGAKTTKASRPGPSAAAKAKDRKQAKRRKKYTTYKTEDLKKAQQYSLCDAMRYIRAVEVGKPPQGPKYDLHVHFKTKRDGATIRGQMKLPHTVKTDIKVCVICPPDSKDAMNARAAGAVLVGEEDIFETLKSGKIDFDRCIAQPGSMQKVTQAGLPRILGPKGLMPSPKLGTVVEDVGHAVSNLMGGSIYRERQGVVRMAVGQMGFTPDQLRANIQAFIQQIRKEAGAISENIAKEIHEVVLSSTHSPGFSLNGEFKSQDSPSPQALSV